MASIFRIPVSSIRINSEWVSTSATDIFSTESILYTIVTGHWPHRGPGPFKTPEDMEIYDQHVEELFRQSKFPDVEGLFGGRVIDTSTPTQPPKPAAPAAPHPTTTTAPRLGLDHRPTGPQPRSGHQVPAEEQSGHQPARGGEPGGGPGAAARGGVRAAQPAADAYRLRLYADTAVSRQPGEGVGGGGEEEGGCGMRGGL
ncbi:hypothetical protein BR93DRAFT_61583 [Coniochaeta sp. PMI_546]|nr:hypothetical protein BR93DRAFT_61583 [Coniochaeta sp. PMI_546]